MIGDVHGAYKALREVLRKMSFSDSDELYFTGDAADGYPDVYRCLCLFREIRHFHPVIGNHDACLQNWLAIGSDPPIWLRQGGAVTVESFRRAHCRQPERLDMAEFLASWPYAIDTGKEYICHGGPGDFLSDEGMEMLAAEKREMVEYIPACYGAYMETDGARATCGEARGWHCAIWEALRAETAFRRPYRALFIQAIHKPAVQYGGYRYRCRIIWIPHDNGHGYS